MPFIFFTDVTHYYTSNTNMKTKKSSFTKTHNVKSRRTLPNNKVLWEHHGVVLTDDETGYQRILLNTIPTGYTGALELYLFTAEKKS
jgi:hypothetical protein